MGAKWLVGLAGMVVATTLAACMAAPEEEVGDGRSNVTDGPSFNKNTLLTDTALRDKGAMSVTKIQSFLEETPYGKKSALADYTEGGKSAAEIIHEAAEKHGVNPLELLVRAQMEQGLIAKTTASDDSIAIAFGCGCPHSPVCSSKYEGFANQAECAAGTLSRSMTRATTETGTVSGWKTGEEKETQDKIEVKPTNAATAALYTYTPWVGEAGGGRKGVGGASLHFQIWNRFAEAIAAPQQPASARNDAGTAAEEEEPEETEEPSTPRADAGSEVPEEPVEADAGTKPSDGGRDAGVLDDGTDGSDDDAILNEGNAPPSTNAPPPGRARSRSSSSSDSENGDPEQATEAELASKKKSSGGCSTTGSSNASDASLVGLAMAFATVIAKRRRRQA